jgi:hypothetical protein
MDGESARAEDVSEGGSSSAAGWRMATDPGAWLGVVVFGLVITFIGLGVDAYKHNNGVGEETLLSFTNPGHVVAGIGLAIAAAAALCGFTVAMLRSVSSAKDVTRRFVPITAAWVAVAASVVTSITYIGATGATVGHSHDTSASVSTISSDQVQTGDPAATSVGSSTVDSNGASTSTHKHDQGKQPTFSQIEASTYSQLASQFPSNTMTAADYTLFKQQVEQVRAFADTIKTSDDARAAGYSIKTGDIPYMGEHWISDSLVVKGVFDPSHPQGLLFSKVDDGPSRLVGVWFLMVPGLNGNTRDVEPAGFAGNLDLWHAHSGLCFTGPGAATENETKASCDAKHGISFTPDLRWMMHVWVVDGHENPDGVFHYLNSDLYMQQVAAGNTNPPLEAEGTIAR